MTHLGVFVFQWSRHIWVFPKIMVPPKSSILIGFSIIFTIHFGVPLLLETSYLDFSPKVCPVTATRIPALWHLKKGEVG